MVEVREVGVLANVDEVPIIDARSPDGFLVDAKPQPADEVQGRGGGRAEARDAARVLGNFRLKKPHVKGHHGRGNAEARVRIVGHAAEGSPSASSDGNAGGRRQRDLGRELTTMDAAREHPRRLVVPARRFRSS